MTLYTNIILIPIKFFPSDIFFQWMATELKSTEINNLNHVEYKIVERDLDARGFEIIS